MVVLDLPERGRRQGRLPGRNALALPSNLNVHMAHSTMLDDATNADIDSNGPRSPLACITHNITD
jgi:hypothetical protein